MSTSSRTAAAGASASPLRPARPRRGRGREPFRSSRRGRRRRSRAPAGRRPPRPRSARRHASRGARGQPVAHGLSALEPARLIVFDRLGEPEAVRNGGRLDDEDLRCPRQAPPYVRTSCQIHMCRSQSASQASSSAIPVRVLRTAARPSGSSATARPTPLSGQRPAVGPLDRPVEKERLRPAGHSCGGRTGPSVSLSS